MEGWRGGSAGPEAGGMTTGAFVVVLLGFVGMDEGTRSIGHVDEAIRSGLYVATLGAPRAGRRSILSQVVSTIARVADLATVSLLGRLTDLVADPRDDWGRRSRSRRRRARRVAHRLARPSFLSEAKQTSFLFELRVIVRFHRVPARLGASRWSDWFDWFDWRRLLSDDRGRWRLNTIRTLASLSGTPLLLGEAALILPDEAAGAGLGRRLGDWGLLGLDRRRA